MTAEWKRTDEDALRDFLLEALLGGPWTICPRASGG